MFLNGRLVSLAFNLAWLVLGFRYRAILIFCHRWWCVWDCFLVVEGMIR